ncbi:putative membrane protein [Salmonella enterica subsp. enterica]|uniref:Putative membrane protein n=1 Tax=Salmonella enterica I TaxID=59201 RepID=A0A447P462_SALET|nr:putative membrane protein [Salmonella enterica subsp. enterica]
MKKKVMSVFFQLAWAALLVISLLYPRSGAPILVGASVWVSMLPRLAACCAVRCRVVRRRSAREEVRAALIKFRAHPRKTRAYMGYQAAYCSVPGVFGMGDHPGVLYLLTLVLYQIARAQLHEPMAA